MNVWTKTALLSAAVLLTVSCTADEHDSAGLNSLASFQWEHRILLIFADEKNGQELTDQLMQDKLLVDDRDMLWFIVDGDRVETNYAGKLDSSFPQTMAQRFQTDFNNPLEVVLIGKDGGVKYRADQLNADEIYFEIIDVMPMPRSEIREGS